MAKLNKSGATVLWKAEKITALPDTDVNFMQLTARYVARSDGRLLKCIIVVMRKTDYAEERRHNYGWKGIYRGATVEKLEAKKAQLKANGYTITT
jgi:hypothetical protein